MYSREQEAAMRRAAGNNAGGFVGSFGGLQQLMPWVRARIWELFGYGLERQPAVERKPRTWTPPTEPGYKGGALSGDVDGAAAVQTSSFVLTEEEKARMHLAVEQNVPEETEEVEERMHVVVEEKVPEETEDTEGDSTHSSKAQNTEGSGGSK